MNNQISQSASNKHFVRVIHIIGCLDDLRQPLYIWYKTHLIVIHFK